MLDSGHPEDRANAEAYRLADRAWQDIRYGLFDHDSTSDFILDPIIHALKTKWKAYCKTGIPENEVQDLADDLKKAHADRLKAWQQTNGASTPPASESPPEMSQGPSKGKSKKQPVLPEQVPILKTDPIILSNLNPLCINEVIEDIRIELGIDRQELEANLQHQVHEYM